MSKVVSEATKKLSKEMNKKFKKLNEDALTVWQNKEIRFDVQPIQLGLRKGEQVVDFINGVEDTKGNNGMKGVLLISNLRIIWHSEKTPKVNLSIGYDCITNIDIKQTKSQLKGKAQALYLRTRFREVRYEFIFTSLSENSPRLFTSFQSTLRSYDTSKLFRDFKIRGAIIQEKDLILLPGEQVYYKQPEVWNITSDHGNLGTLFITNVRVAWFANVSESFNISLPHIQIKSLKKRDSQVLTVETTRVNGQYALGFRSHNLEELFNELMSIFRLAIENPLLGVQVAVQEVQPPVEQVKQERVFDDIEIVEPQFAGQSNAAAAYFVSEASGEQDIVFSEELGLAIERTPDNISIEQLWRII